MTYDLFDVLRSQKIDVAELIFSKQGNLVINKDVAQKTILEHREFFAERLGLSSNASVSEIYKLISRSFNNPLEKIGKYADLTELLQGTTRDNAGIAQIIQDIKLSEKYIHCDFGKRSFYAKSADGLDAFKAALLEGLNSKTSSYGNVSTSVKDYLTKLIESITDVEYSRRLEKTSKFFQNADYEQKQFRALKNLARKLEEVQKFGSNISLN